MDTLVSLRDNLFNGQFPQSKIFYTLLAIVVFWLVAPLGVAGIGLPVVVDVQWVWLTAAAIILQIWMLLINDRKGFIRSREMRRAYEVRGRPRPHRGCASG